MFRTLVVFCLVFVVSVISGCDSEGGGGSSNSLSGTITFDEGDGDEHVSVFLFENPVLVNDPQESDVVASTFPVLSNNSTDFSFTNLNADVYDLAVWIDMDNSNNGVFDGPTAGDRMLEDPYYVTVTVDGSTTQNFSSFPVVHSDDSSPDSHYVTTRTITVDGDPSDWSGMSAAITDDTGDDTGSNSGTDIQDVFLAVDSENLYVRIDLADGDPNSTLPVFYGLKFDDDNVYEVGDFLLFNQYSGQWYAQVDVYVDTQSGFHNLVAYGEIAIGPSLMEMSYPLVALGNPTGQTRHVRAFCDPSGSPFDDTESIAAILP